MTLKESDQAMLQAGDEAPAFELPDTTGEPRSLEDFDDYAAVLIVFTCNHCPYAKAKIPVLNALAEDFDDVAVIGINPNDAAEHPDDSFDAMQDLVADGTVRYDAYLRDEEQAVAAAYGAVCTPDPFLFANDDGTFRLVYHGRLDDALNPDDEPSERIMRQVIETVLAGEAVEQEFLPSQGCSIKWKNGNAPDWW